MNYNEHARHIHQVNRGQDQHLVKHEPSAINFYCYSEGPYHAAHLFHCAHNFYPFGATVVNMATGKKTKLKHHDK